MKIPTFRKAMDDESGVALVEFAIILPVLVLIVAGVVDYTMYFQAKMQLQDQAAAGAAYGATNGNQNNLTMMQYYATYNDQNSPFSPTSSYSATAANVFYCTPGGAVVSYNSTCSSNPAGTPIEYVQVKTQAIFNTFVVFPGVPSKLTLTGSATYRVPWCATGASTC